MGRPINEPPLPGSEARFAEGFGQRFLLTVDTEEEFDWNADFSVDDHGLYHITRLSKFQEFCEAQGVTPVYLVDWPIVTSDLAVDILKKPLEKGTAEIGIQLHPWVNPPHDEEVNENNSFAGNLPPELERAKFEMLRTKIVEKFGTSPMIYRAGRYGTGANTAQMLIDAGVAIDTSVRSNFNYQDTHGNDYRGHPLKPYWIEHEHLLEIPVTTVFWGMLRRQGRWFHYALPSLRGVMAKIGMLERIPLTPEGTTAEEAVRGIDIALDDGLPVLVLSFHSPSLAPGFTPYVRSEEDLDALYDWFRQVFSYLNQRGVKPAKVEDVMKAVQV